MTAALTFVLFFLMWAWFGQYGPMLTDGWTIYAAAFKLVTVCAATFSFVAWWRSIGEAARRGVVPDHASRFGGFFILIVLLHNSRWCNFRAACFILAYAACAPLVYYAPSAILASAALDLAMAAYFVIFGARRWELAAGACFIIAVFASGLTALGVIPSHLERAPTFLAWSQPDITAILGYAALIAIGLGSGDGGSRAVNYLGRRSVVAGYRRSAFLRLGLVAQTKGA